LEGKEGQKKEFETGNFSQKFSRFVFTKQEYLEADGKKTLGFKNIR